MNQINSPAPGFRHGDAPTSRDNGVAPMIDAIQVGLAKHPYLKNARVLDHHGELPGDVRDYLTNAGLTPSHVKGVYTEGTAYLIAGNLSSVEDGLRTALHEVVGHHGVRALLGEHFEPVMHDLYDTFPRDHAAWQDTASRYGYLDTGTEAGQVAFAEEVAAHMAEEDVSLSEFDMIHAEIQAAMREIVPTLPMTEKEVTALLQRSRESLIMRHGDPETAEEVRQRQQLRSKAADSVMRYQRKEGMHSPDALSAGLYRNGSQVLDDKNMPTRLFHGSGGDMSQVEGMLWGSVTPKLANEYAAMRADMGEPATVVPYYADIQRPFDGDALNKESRSPTVVTFAYEVIRQGGLTGADAEAIKEQARRVLDIADREESGPHYTAHNFWYRPHSMFGRDGAEIIADMFEQGGFDGVRYTELGHFSYGAFSPGQLHFLDQGASPRGWQPDRSHGEGDMTARPAFKQWFGDSAVATPEGEPRVMYHGTTGDFSTFDPRKISALDMDAQCNGFWFSSRPDASPAKQEASSVMPVYLSIQAPANEDVVNAMAKQVNDDGRWRPGARSQHDEVRFRLEDQGYDGFFFRNMTALTADQKAAFEHNGEVNCSLDGNTITLRRASEPEMTLAPVESRVDMLVMETPVGQKTANLSLSAAIATLAEAGREMGSPLLAEGDALAKAIGQIETLMSGQQQNASIGDIQVYRKSELVTEMEWQPTGQTRDRVDVYDSMSGLATSYGSLEDFERLVAVAFKPEQIKSAIGNRGAFLQNHPDIRFALGDAARDAQPERQTALQDWFQGSAVVGDRGEPLVVYHGTLSNFDNFNHDWIGEGHGAQDFGEGFYFTNRPDAASQYAEGAGGNVRPVYLNIQNPANFDVMMRQDVQDAIEDDMGFTCVAEVLEKMGYDGVAVDREGGTEYVAFRPEQITSAFGSPGPRTPDKKLTLDTRARDNDTPDHVTPDMPAVNVVGPSMG